MRGSIEKAGTVAIVLAALFWGVAGGIGGLLVTDGLNPFAVAFYRGVIGLACVSPWLVSPTRRRGLRHVRLWAWSSLAGLAVAGNFATYFISIAHGNVSIASTLMYSAPVFVCLASFALKLERPTLPKLFAISGVVLGIVLLTRIHDVGACEVTPLAVGAGLLSGVCYAVFIFAFKSATRHGSSQLVLTISFAVLSTALIWPALLDTDSYRPRPEHALWLAALGVLGAGVSFTLYVVGIRNTKPSTASIVAMVEPVTASLFGVFLLGESLVASQLLGMTFILVAVTALSGGFARAKPVRTVATRLLRRARAPRGSVS